MKWEISDLSLRTINNCNRNLILWYKILKKILKETERYINTCIVIVRKLFEISIKSNINKNSKTSK